MNKIIVFLFTVFVCISATAEPLTGKTTLSGKITDKADGGPLTGVNVYLPELSEGTTTDENGTYKINNLPCKKVQVQISYLGHQTIVRTIDLSKVSTMNFIMQESNATIHEVVVTGLTGQSLMKDSPTPISIVNTEQLHATSSTNIIDALSHQPGISQITTGSGISKPVIRGLGFNRVVVVNDGVRQEGNQWGGEHGIEIDPQSISSAEILKGPASLMYGSDAMAGVIIFHGEPILAQNTMQANVSSEYQTNNGLFDYSVDFKGNQNGLVWNGRWSDKMAHDYKDKYDQYVLGSQFRERAAEGLIGVNKSWGYSHVLLSYYHLTPGITEGERGYSHSYYDKELPFQQVHHYKAVSDNSFYIGDGTLSATFAYQQNRRQEFEDSPSVPGLDLMLHTVNYNIKYLFPESNGWKFATGANGMYQRLLNKGDEFLIPAYQLFDIGIFGTSTYQAGNWTLSGGIRYDNRHLHSFALADRFEKLSRNFSGLTGSIGAVYALQKDMNVRLNLSRGFRAPNLSELASNGVHDGTVEYELGNSKLNPEYSWQIDAGWDYTSPIISSQLSLFTNFIDNFIFTHKLENIKTEGYDTYQYVQGNARLMGGEFSIDLHPLEPLHFQNSFSYVNSIQLHQPKESKYLPFTPAPRWDSDLRYDFIRDGKTFNNTYLSISMECDLRQNHFYAADNTETATPSYTLFNLAAGTDIRNKGKKLASIYLTCNNIFDKAYQSHLSRLKYITSTPDNGHPGIYNMGRNIGIKVLVPVNF